MGGFRFAPLFYADPQYAALGSRIPVHIWLLCDLGHSLIDYLLLRILSLSPACCSESASLASLMASASLAALFTISAPVIQAPMVGVSTPRLAAAVSNAGGLGSLGLGASKVEDARSLIRATQKLTSRPFAVNFFCHHRATSNPVIEKAWMDKWKAQFEKEFGGTITAGDAFSAPLSEIYDSFVGNDLMAKMVLEEKPAVVSFHFGLPDVSVIQALQAKGVVVMATATNGKEAEVCESAGIDAIVAQGYEAGGHRGIFDPAHDSQLSTFSLLQLLSTRVKTPLIAAGGIMNGQGIFSAVNMGASAVQLGTAFLLCDESATSAQHRELLLHPPPPTLETGVTAAISGRPARGLVNYYYSQEHQVWHSTIPEYPIAYDLQKRVHAVASRQGNHEFAAYWAGQCFPLCRSMDAASLINALNEEYKSARSIQKPL